MYVCEYTHSFIDVEIITDVSKTGLGLFIYMAMERETFSETSDSNCIFIYLMTR
jgi:hypothetical protein